MPLLEGTLFDDFVEQIVHFGLLVLLFGDYAGLLLVHVDDYLSDALLAYQLLRSYRFD